MPAGGCQERARGLTSSTCIRLVFSSWFLVLGFRVRGSLNSAFWLLHYPNPGYLRHLRFSPPPGSSSFTLHSFPSPRDLRHLRKSAVTVPSSWSLVSGFQFLVLRFGFRPLASDFCILASSLSLLPSSSARPRSLPRYLPTHPCLSVVESTLVRIPV